jgi:phage terminase large subunit-like protein
MTLHCDTAFHLTARQLEANKLLASDKRHVMLYGGARSGKTFLLCRAIVIRALKAQGSRHLIARFRFNHVKQSIGFDTLPKVLALCFPDVTYRLDKSDWVFRFPNGSEIWLGGLDEKERTEKILGQEYATVYLNECSQIAESAVILVRTRLAQVVPGLDQRAYYDCNPPGTAHWSYRMFVEGREPRSRQPLKNADQYAAMVLNPSDNAENLSPDYLAELRALPEKQYKRFWEGRFIAELDNALWTLDVIEKSRHPEGMPIPGLRRVVVAVDPSGAAGEEDKRSDEIGIVVAGESDDGDWYVLDDLTLRAGPEQWARTAIHAYHTHRADRIVVERNYGGAMAMHTIQSVDRNVPVTEVTASRGKAVRAEPIAALYEKQRVHHVGVFPDLEDQLINFTSAGYMGDRSLDRADALVWALSELTQGPMTEYLGMV